MNECVTNEYGICLCCGKTLKSTTDLELCFFNWYCDGEALQNPCIYDVNDKCTRKEGEKCLLDDVREARERLQVVIRREVFKIIVEGGHRKCITPLDTEIIRSFIPLKDYFYFCRDELEGGQEIIIIYPYGEMSEIKKKIEELERGAGL